MISIEIPSPGKEWQNLLEFGGLTITSYALIILTGIVVAVWMTRKRWEKRGGEVAVIEEIALWAIPFGIVGGRIYHVVSSGYLYFGSEENWFEGEQGNWVDALQIWDGGLGIWGAIAFGALGAYIGCRRAGVSFATFMDAAAPGILLAQAIGRLGNYFNHELYGRPTELPWGLSVDPAISYTARAYPEGTLFHPTFLYEMLWSLAGVALLLWADKRFQLRWGRVFWLYVVAYTSGRLWIETVRIDDAAHVLGLRINVWVSIFVLAGGALAFWLIGRRHRDEKVPELPAAPAKKASSSTKAGSAKSPAKGSGAKKTPAKSTAAKKPAAKAAAAKKTPAKKASGASAAASGAKKVPGKK